jgi:hypothetical protein
MRGHWLPPAGGDEDDMRVGEKKALLFDATRVQASAARD